MRLRDDEQKKLLSDMAKEVVRKLGLKAGSFRGIVQITPAEDSRPKEFILYFVPSEMSKSKKLMLEVLDTFSITYLKSYSFRGFRRSKSSDLQSRMLSLEPYDVSSHVAPPSTTGVTTNS